MQEFSVPQFIDVEDKIIGPITTRQFITMLFGAVIIFVLYRILSFGFFLLFGLTIAGATIAFAFVRMNGQPFHLFLLNIVKTFERPSLRIWGKEIEIVRAGAKKEAHIFEAIPGRILPTASRISELSLMVDTGGAYQGEEEK
jgi:hypothetical protein